MAYTPDWTSSDMRDWYLFLLLPYLHRAGVLLGYAFACLSRFPFICMRVSLRNDS